MKITAINFAEVRSRYSSEFALTPMMMGAMFGRLSRTDDSLSALFSKHGNSTPHRVMDMAGYGHASMADNVIIPLEFKGISVWLSSVIFGYMSQYGAIEKSSRFCPNGFKPLYSRHLESWQSWNEAAIKIQEEKSSAKRIAYLDTIRYSLPLSSETTLAIVASAREWQKLLLKLNALSFSTTLREGPNFLARKMYSVDNIAEIDSVTFLLQEVLEAHTDGFSYFDKGSIPDETQSIVDSERRTHERFYNSRALTLGSLDARFTNNLKSIKEELFSTLKMLGNKRWVRSNRYSPYPSFFDTVMVDWGYCCTFAEHRDMNRQRNRTYRDWIFIDCEEDRKEDMSHIVFRRENLTLSQFLYTLELRSGPGAHNNYRKIVLDSYDDLFHARPMNEAAIQRPDLIEISGFKDTIIESGLAYALSKIDVFINQPETKDIK